MKPRNENLSADQKKIIDSAIDTIVHALNKAAQETEDLFKVEDGANETTLRQVKWLTQSRAINYFWCHLNNIKIIVSPDEVKNDSAWHDI
jgi:hypothetical protein